MSIYVRNRRCPCVRCRTRGMMGGAILVTLGILFLLEEYRIAYFDRSWPVLLIVIGLFSFAARSGSTEGHIQPSWVNAAFPQANQGSNAPAPPGQNPSGPGPEVKS